MTSLDSFRCCKTLKVGSKTYAYYSLPTAEKNGLKGISRLPFSMKVLLENLLRNEDGRTVTKDDIKAFSEWLKNKTSEQEIAFRPARVLLQDFTGVPCVVDLAAMRDALAAMGKDSSRANPLMPDIKLTPPCPSAFASRATKRRRLCSFRTGAISR